MKTPIKVLLEDLKQTRDLCYAANLHESVGTLDDIIERSTILLYNEKLMIFDVYQDCQDNVLKMIMEKIKMPSMIQYYNDKFNQ